MEDSHYFRIHFNLPRRWDSFPPFFFLFQTFLRKKKERKEVKHSFHSAVATSRKLRPWIFLWKSLEALKQRRTYECDSKEKFLQQENLLTTVDRVFLRDTDSPLRARISVEFFPCMRMSVCIKEEIHMDGTTYFAKRYLLTAKHLQTNVYLPVHYIHLTTAPSIPLSSSYWTLVYRFLRIRSVNFSWKLPTSSRSITLMVYFIYILFILCSKLVEFRIS